jgi:hypothetical protein
MNETNTIDELFDSDVSSPEPWDAEADGDINHALNSMQTVAAGMSPKRNSEAMENSNTRHGATLFQMTYDNLKRN